MKHIACQTLMRTKRWKGQSIRVSEVINMNRRTGEIRIVKLDQIKKTILEILLKAQG